MIVNIPTSIGDLVDRLTILLIKIDKINDPTKKVNIQTEYELLDAELKKACQTFDPTKGTQLLQLTSQLKEINEFIWNVEDEIRDHERQQNFGPSFIQLARHVYIFNDRRASRKREINDLFNSTIKEEKSYKAY
jgi:hypothetical protein